MGNIQPPKGEPINLHFKHGGGDCALFAHALPLWIRRGFDIRIYTDENKKPLFQAAGVGIADHYDLTHEYRHPPNQHANMMNDWCENKCAWNLTEAPMPSIGTQAELWQELLSVQLTLKDVVTKEQRKEIDAWLKSLPSKPILIHTRANTSAPQKNLGEMEETDLYRNLLKQTDNTIILLDWDNRVSWFHHLRLRHLSEFKGISLPELWYLMECSALVIGVDSCPLHFSRFCPNTPALGLWYRHHPAKFALPRDKTLHMVEAHHGRWNSVRRHSYNIVDLERLSGAAIASHAARLVVGAKPADLTLEAVVAKLDTSKGDRDKTFKAALAMNPASIIETGTMRGLDDWTAGGSSYVFGMYLRNKGSGSLDSVDLSANNVKFSREHTEPFADYVKVHEGDSLAYLSQRTERADLVYLDSLDTDEPGCAEHGLAEAKLAVKLTNTILIDDSWFAVGKFNGKGEKAIPWLLEQGWKIHPSSGYQVLLTKPSGLKDYIKKKGLA